MFFLAFALAGCEKEDTGKDSTGDTEVVTDSEDTGETGDTNVDTQETDTVEPCTIAVLEMSPTDGTTEVYYRDPMSVLFDADGSAATFLIADTEGNTIEPTPVWGDGNLRVELAATLAPSTTYTLTASICGVDSTTSFTTSMLGTPLIFPPEDLVGAVYMFRISDATITEPAVLDLLGDSYLTSPLLFEVEQADATSITLLGALGEASGTSFAQVAGASTWPFPPGDFSSSPTFYAEADAIYITYEDIEIPIEHFTLRGTFTYDGAAIEQGYTTGFLDTAELGPLFGLSDDPGALCEFADSFGIECIPCDDGEVTCVAVIGEDIRATYQEGVDVVAVP